MSEKCKFDGVSSILYTDENYAAGESFTFLFSIMWKEKKVSDVYRDERTGEYLVLNYTDEAVKLAFAGGPVTDDRLYDYFADRCIDRARPDLADRLHEIGLDSYNPYKLVRKTHGVMWDDYQWVRFPGDKTKWEDVKLRD